MKYILFLIFIISKISLAQEYDSVFLEEENIDSNNKIYKTGNVYTFDYEIIKNDTIYKLKSNGSFGRFELGAINSTLDFLVDEIILMVQPYEVMRKRINDNQTNIAYLQSPEFYVYETTSLVDNDKNIWLHPLRNNFFSALETCPFPYIQLPITITTKWRDSMVIGEFTDDLWGNWKGDLRLNYAYEIEGKSSLQTNFGEIEVFIINSKAESTVGTSYLKSYFNEKYGFIRLEYQFFTGMKMNMWLTKFEQNKKINDAHTFFKTKILYE